MYKANEGAPHLEHPRSLLCQLKYSYFSKKAIVIFSFF